MYYDFPYNIVIFLTVVFFIVQEVNFDKSIMKISRRRVSLNKLVKHA